MQQRLKHGETRPSLLLLFDDTLLSFFIFIFFCRDLRFYSQGKISSHFYSFFFFHFSLKTKWTGSPIFYNLVFSPWLDQHGNRFLVQSVKLADVVQFSKLCFILKYINMWTFKSMRDKKKKKKTIYWSLEWPKLL